MAKGDYVGTNGQKVNRQALVMYVDTAESGSAHDFEIMGTGVESASIETNISTEKTTDINGNVESTTKSEGMSMTLDNTAVKVGSWLEKKLITAMRNNDMAALSGFTVLVVWAFISGGTDSSFVADLYTGASIVPTNIGGDGGSTLNISEEVTLAGTVTHGTVTMSSGKPTFTAD